MTARLPHRRAAVRHRDGPPDRCPGPRPHPAPRPCAGSAPSSPGPTPAASRPRSATRCTASATFDVRGTCRPPRPCSSGAVGRPRPGRTCAGTRPARRPRSGQGRLAPAPPVARRPTQPALDHRAPRPARAHPARSDGLELVSDQPFADSPARAVLYRQTFGGLVPATRRHGDRGRRGRRHDRLRLVVAGQGHRRGPHRPTLTPRAAGSRPRPTSSAPSTPADLAKITSAVSAGWTRLTVPGFPTASGPAARLREERRHRPPGDRVRRRRHQPAAPRSATA